MLQWLNGILSAVSWWVKLIIIGGTSFLATLLPVPIPIADIAFIGTVGHFKSIWWLIAIILFITILDTIFAVLTYRWSHKLSRVIVRNEAKRKKLEEINEKLHRQAPFWLFIAGVTPFPFTLTIYAAATLKYDIKKFTILMFFSRLTKYIVTGALYYLGFQLMI